MGFRDFLKRSLGRGDKNSDSDDSSMEDTRSSSAPRNTASTPPRVPSMPLSQDGGGSAVAKARAASSSASSQSPSQTGAPPKPDQRKVVRMAEDPATGEVNVHKRYGSETVQEKINRVKAGKMTDDEKKAFLQTALSAGDTSVSRPPLRTSSGYDDGDGSNRGRGKASPFPKDSIIRKNFSLGSSRDLEGSSSLDSQKKKREYLEMVTNPDRFRTYKTPVTSNNAGVNNDNNIYNNNNDWDPSDDLDRFDNPSINNSNNNNNKFSNRKTVESSIPSIPAMPNDLGARLGAHALANEKLQADLRRQAEEERREKERQLEEERKEQERRDREAQRLREAEVARREREAAERKRAQEEAKMRAEEEERRKEEERVRELVQAQEAYWAKKLKAERSLRDGNGKKGATMDFGPEAGDDPTANPDAADVNGAAQDESQAQQPNQPESNGSYLNDVKRTPRQSPPPSPWNFAQRTAADILGRNRGKETMTSSSSSSATSSSAFQAERARQKAEIDRTKAMQLERLKALNSPLPSPPASNSRSASPAPPLSSYQRTANSPGARSLGGLSRTVNAAPTKSIRDDDEDDLFPQKEVFGSGLPPPEPTATNTNNNNKPAWSRIVGNAGAKSPPAPAPAPPRPTPPPAKNINQRQASPNIPAASSSAGRGPIRQQLPFNQEDGIAREDRGMSIAEIMQRVKREAGDDDDDDDGNSNSGSSSGRSTQFDRSKKWGVDMSRFRE